MTTQAYSYRGYEISITHMPPVWEAQIYSAVSGIPPVDRTEPIRATTAKEAHLLAQRRIDEILSKMEQ